MQPPSQAYPVCYGNIDNSDEKGRKAIDHAIGIRYM